jgi:ATP-dependent Clp protease ATP-binding subunit ClpC
VKAGGVMGFSDADTGDKYDEMKGKIEEAMKRTFNPEFLNRVDDTIVFHSLTREEIGQIVHILMADVRKRLQAEGLSLRLTEGAVDFLVKEGYDEKFGARPLRRAIQRYLEDPLSEKILQAEFSSGDEIEVDVGPDGHGLTLQVESATKT